MKHIPSGPIERRLMNHFARESMILLEPPAPPPPPPPETCEHIDPELKLWPDGSAAPRHRRA